MSDLLSFEEILGQDQAISRLKAAQAQNRLPHAYLFVGPEGVGRQTVARAFFRRLLCTQGQGCGRCKPCQKFAKGLHPDVEIIEPQGKSVRIEQIRELEAKLRFRPLEASCRLILFPQAELLTREAANALLKSLEEPPPYNLFILIALTTESLLPTIVSRCQVVRFRPLPAQILFRLLTERFDKLPEEAQGLSLLAEGSIGRALRLSEKGFLQEMERFVLAIKRASPSQIVSLVEILSRLKEELPLFLELLLVWLRHSLWSSSPRHAYPSGLPEPPPKAFILPAMEKIEKCFWALERNLNLEILFLVLTTELAHLWQEASSKEPEKEKLEM